MPSIIETFNTPPTEKITIEITNYALYDLIRDIYLKGVDDHILTYKSLEKAKSKEEAEKIGQDSFVRMKNYIDGKYIEITKKNKK